MFYSPHSREELIKILAGNLDNTYFIAGGTDLILHINNHKLTDYHIVDLTKLNEFHYIREDDEKLYIGALTTMTEICESEIIYKDFRSVYQAAYELGSELIRNRATIGGNIANASQCADVLLACFSFDANIKILNKNNEEKIIPISELVTGRNQTILNPDDIIIEIIIEKSKEISSFRKVGSRKAVTISKLNCSAVLLVEEDIIKKANIFLGSVGTKASKAEILEKEFLGKKLSELNLNNLQKAAFEEVEKAIPTRDSKYYKRVAVQGLIENIYEDLVNYE